MRCSQWQIGQQQVILTVFYECIQFTLQVIGFLHFEIEGCIDIATLQITTIDLTAVIAGIIHELVITQMTDIPYP